MNTTVCGGAQNRLMDKVDDFEKAVLGLTEVVVENCKLVSENRDLIIENREMLRAIIKHLEVPYEKPPMGFRQE